MVLQALTVCIKFSLEGKERVGTLVVSTIHMGCYNASSLMKADGNITTGMNRPCGCPLTWLLSVNHIEFLAHELKRLGMNAVQISVTKWFGQAVYLVDGCAVVHSGRPVPVSGDAWRRCGCCTLSCDDVDMEECR